MIRTSFNLHVLLVGLSLGLWGMASAASTCDGVLQGIAPGIQALSLTPPLKGNLNAWAHVFQLQRKTATTLAESLIYSVLPSVQRQEDRAVIAKVAQELFLTPDAVWGASKAAKNTEYWVSLASAQQKSFQKIARQFDALLVERSAPVEQGYPEGTCAVLDALAAKTPGYSTKLNYWRMHIETRRQMAERVAQDLSLRGGEWETIATKILSVPEFTGATVEEAIRLANVQQKIYEEAAQLAHASQSR